jgi:hypothetical protein
MPGGPDESAAGNYATTGTRKTAMAGSEAKDVCET